MNESDRLKIASKPLQRAALKFAAECLLPRPTEEEHKNRVIAALVLLIEAAKEFVRNEPSD